MESFFNDAEKRFLLAEMIKPSQLDVDVLVDFLKSHGVEPDWLKMQIPPGRNMSQCLHAADVMFQTPMRRPVFSPLKRKSMDDLPDSVWKRRAVASPGEVSPRGVPLTPTIQPAPGSQLAQTQPRSAPPPPTPSVSVYPPGRRRGRPPKSVQSTWQVTTYQPIAPSTTPTSASQPHSPGLQVHSVYQVQGSSDPKLKKKALPEIAPRPAQGMSGAEPAARSPAMPGAEYQNWRDETSRREYYQVQAAEPPTRDTRDRPASTYAPILPRPRSPFPPPRELPRPASAEPRHYRTTPPANAPEPLEKESHTRAPEPIKT